MKRSWPGQMRTVYGDHKRFIDTYFLLMESILQVMGAKEIKILLITGRVDDVIIVSGHNLGTAEIESFVSHKDVSRQLLLVILMI